MTASPEVGTTRDTSTVVTRNLAYTNNPHSCSLVTLPPGPIYLIPTTQTVCQQIGLHLESSYRTETCPLRVVHLCAATGFSGVMPTRLSGSLSYSSDNLCSPTPRGWREPWNINLQRGRIFGLVLFKRRVTDQEVGLAEQRQLVARAGMRFLVLYRIIEQDLELVK